MINKESSTICQKNEGLKVDQHDYSRCSTSSASEVSTPATRPLDRYIMKCTTTYSNILIYFLNEIVNGIFLVVFFVFVAILTIFIHFLVACTIAYRILHHRQTTNTTGIISSEEQQEESGGVSFGLSWSDLQNLSSFKCEMVEPTGDCIVCLERFVKGESCRSLPGCKHVYHANCVDSWLIRVPACPLCRQIVVIPGMDPLPVTDSHS
ncbi:hypothetical protein MKW94_015643 [Papaver nudicaule]|uniref:RING-type domain-containing protein n=1 Tax=Papaver nudicaule TaxID=74823 RepID=A0AA41VVT5_PAPNU|nr:hypothetical protein [Papaver nudicaule]